ncbi:Uncharacterised protein [Vibrio cholerae]|nr:Uncharacterised protein [Vibrio cholerae]CSI77932.1 Uncharacterised protein [Vibrio cholerae]
MINTGRNCLPQRVVTPLIEIEVKTTESHIDQRPALWILFRLS